MYDVYGLGNALVDMEYHVDDEYLRRHDIAKGHMTLVEAERMDSLIDGLAELTPARMSGGSAANTIIAVQGFGGATYYSCKVAADATGAFFIDDLNAAGVHTNPHDKNVEGASGRCLVLVTGDAERSMNTFLGVSSELSELQINEDALRGSRYFYVEGYLSSSPLSTDAAIRCLAHAEAHGVETAVSLSDPSMIEFFRDELTRMLGNGVKHLFCNEEEALSWARTDRLDLAVNELKDISRSLNITLGSRGSMTVEGGVRVEVPGESVQAVDTTGAGDIYAGACLHGWSAGMDAAMAARFGNYAAARLVSEYGARFRNIEDYANLLKHFT